MEPICISPLVYQALTLDAWNALPDHDRVLAADHLAERLEAAGWSLLEPPAVRTFGPPDQPQRIVQVRDGKTGLPWSLVPGGTFRPGIPTGLLPQFQTVYLAFESWKAQSWEPPDEEDDQDGPDQWQPESPSAVWPFASEAPCDLTEKPPQRIEPLLFAAELVTPRVPGLHEAVTPPAGYWKDRWERGKKSFDCWQTRWPEVQAVLDHFGWELPTSWEFEWAVRGGVDGLFYWGGPPPLFQGPDAALAQSGPFTLEELFAAVMTYSFPPDRPRTWPWCNRFGLAAMLGAGTWCCPSEVQDDPVPLIVRGGAAMGWPWQACKEWVLLLTSCESRQAPQTNYADHNAIRPVVRFVADPAVPLA
jgi:hypothetical protein